MYSQNNLTNTFYDDFKLKKTPLVTMVYTLCDVFLNQMLRDASSRSPRTVRAAKWRCQTWDRPWRAHSVTAWSQSGWKRWRTSSTTSPTVSSGSILIINEATSTDLASLMINIDPTHIEIASHLLNLGVEMNCSNVSVRCFCGVITHLQSMLK